MCFPRSAHYQSLIIALPVFAAQKSNLDLLCKRPTGILIGAICELKDKVAALENSDPLQGPPGPQGEKGEQGEPGPLIFPEPKFESDWIVVPPQTAVIDVPHTVGGDPADYFIYLTYRRPATNGTYTSHQTGDDKIWWEDVEPDNIQIATNGDVTNIFEAVKIRIWKIGE